MLSIVYAKVEEDWLQQNTCILLQKWCLNFCSMWLIDMILHVLSFFSFLLIRIHLQYTEVKSQYML